MSSRPACNNDQHLPLHPFICREGDIRSIPPASPIQLLPSIRYQQSSWGLWCTQIFHTKLFQELWDGRFQLVIRETWGRVIVGRKETQGQAEPHAGLTMSATYPLSLKFWCTVYPL
ncbi:hypothetical protein FS842_010919 [Serendipita sp. 407]|nr:hypothetical protein FS842_010919 [Serendipita sp. 407]